METENTPPAPFLSKTYDMVDDLSTDPVVSWSKANNSFVVWNVPEFTRHILPKYFKHNNFSSFVRQLNTYGYRKVDPDCWEFANEGFLRGHKHLLKTIIRRKPSQMQVHQETSSQVQSVSVESCVEVGKFGIEEEVERLKRDKTVHTEELVRLQQQQQVTDHRLENVGQRLQLMEERQQQTMSFLAKALQSPGFIAELVHQQNESNRRISGMNKKRRFPNNEEENYAGKPVGTLHDRQIVRYQPLMNEAAIALLQKILKNNASDRLETKVKNSNGFLTNHARSFENTLDAGGPYNRTSRVTVPQLPTSSQSHPISDSGISFNPETFGITDLKQLDTGDIPYIDAMHMDNVTSAVPDGFSTDRDADVFMDKMPKLPGINDIFWDQVLSASPLTGDKHDIGSLALEDDLAKEEDVTGVQQRDWHKMKYHMSHLTS